MKELSYRARWLTVFVYAIAMAWVEAAVVYYLRTMVDRIEPYQPNPLPIFDGLGPAELIREAATLVMLATIGILAGKTWRSRLGFSAMAFGIWDILYYVFLKKLCGWPHSVFNWDILFLLPFPWWGPVLAPLCIALLMVVWGTMASLGVDQRNDWRVWMLNFVGIATALYVFMADSIKVASHGVDAVRNVLPVAFNWPLFGLALIFMSAPVVVEVQHWRQANSAQKTTRASESEGLSVSTS